MTARRIEAFLPVPSSRSGGTQGGYTASGCGAMHEMHCSCDPMRARRAVPPEAPIPPLPYTTPGLPPLGLSSFFLLEKEGEREEQIEKRALEVSRAPIPRAPLGGYAGGTGRYGPAPLG